MIKKILIKYSEFIRYVLVGVINTIFGFFVYSVFLFFGAHFSIASLGATIIGSGFNYITYSRVVFNSKQTNKKFLKFLLIYASLYVFSLLIISLFKKMNFNDYIAGIFNFILIPVVSYILNKFFVFRK